MELLFDFENDRKGYIEDCHKQDGHTCWDCNHRERWELNQYSPKVIQCCNVQKSKRSNSGYKKVKVTDKACWLWTPIVNN
jgi:hypothetical protein